MQRKHYSGRPILRRAAPSWGGTALILAAGLCFAGVPACNDRDRTRVGEPTTSPERDENGAIRVDAEGIVGRLEGDRVELEIPLEGIVTGFGHVNYDAIPGVCYTHPEIASVGKTEEELNAQNIPFKKGSFPFMANGRARALGATEGRVKILAHAKTDRILGVHIIGPRAGDLIAEAAVAIEFSASAEDIARSSHAHPTLAEVMKEAALSVDRRAIHI